MQFLSRRGGILAASIGVASLVIGLPIAATAGPTRAEAGRRMHPAAWRTPGASRNGRGIDRRMLRGHGPYRPLLADCIHVRGIACVGRVGTQVSTVVWGSAW